MTSSPLTICERLSSCLAELQKLAANRDPVNTASREFAIAAHSIEDAMMRTNVGFAKLLGTQSYSDMERVYRDKGQNR